MKIEICDMCKIVPDSSVRLMNLYRFESKEDYFFIKPDVITLCRQCLEKLFPPKQSV